MSLTVLFVVCFPFTVSWLIVPIIVNSFNRPSMAGMWTHISYKRFEAITPTLTNSDSAAAIVFPITVIWPSPCGSHGSSPGSTDGRGRPDWRRD